MGLNTLRLINEREQIEKDIADKEFNNSMAKVNNSNFGELCNAYRNYVGKAETREERVRRINNFRCS